MKYRVLATLAFLTAFAANCGKGPSIFGLSSKKAGSTNGANSSAGGDATASTEVPDTVAPASRSPIALAQSRLIGGATLDPNSFWPPLGQICSTSLDSTGIVSTEVPLAYKDSCAGCHGPNGTGHNEYTSIVGPRTYTDFETIVRKGRLGKSHEMPAFKSDWLDDDNMRRIYAYIAKSPLVETKVCKDAPVMSDAAIATAMKDGLATWRKPDGKTDPKGLKSNVACANCHAPDTLELAYFGYSDSQILRRGVEHLPAQEVANIVDMVHAYRTKYKIGRRDPSLVRPFQPGGGVVPGNTMAARDESFGSQLVQANYSFAKKPVLSAADADKAIDDVWAIDRHSLRIPIPFNHYTEDGFNNPLGYVPNCDADIDGCADHGSFADWISVAPHIPKDAAKFYASADALIQTPNDKNFSDFRFTASQTAPSGTYVDGATKDMDAKKYPSMVLMNYCIRLEVLGGPGCFDKGVAPFPNQADIWDIGANINLFGTGFSQKSKGDCNTLWTNCGDLPKWPQHLLDDLTPKSKLSSHFSRLRHTWMAMWWIHFDPTLLVTGDPTAQKDEYFTRSLFWSNANDWKFDDKSADGPVNPTYSIFTVFQLMMHNVATLKNPQLASCKVFPATDFACTQIEMRAGTYPDVINFAEGNQPQGLESGNNIHYQTLYQPTEPGRRATYQMMTANLYRMFFWKLIGAMEQDNWICEKDLQANRIIRGKLFIDQAETQSVYAAEDKAMFDKLNTLMATARKSCPAQTGGRTN
ncbi:MAG: cytochrome c [Chitinophagaceae bacterium]|nr:cytochrome c [Oligoflexus sp.]